MIEKPLELSSFNYQALSVEAKEIILDGSGYRNESFGTGEFFKILDVINFEIIELGNEDIQVTCHLLYENDYLVSLEKYFSNLDNVYGL